METNAKMQSVIREVLNYTLWLVLGVVPVLLLIFLVAHLVFRTTAVPNQALVLVVAALWVVTYLRLKKNGMNFGDIWLKFSPRPKLLVDLLLGFIIGASFITIIFVSFWGTGLIAFRPAVLTGSLVLILLATLVYTLIQSGTEELIFRGYLLKVLARKGNTFAILVTSLVFSIMHFHHGVNPIGWLNIFLFGVLMAQMVFTWNNLLIPVGFHTGWNFFQLNVFTFSVYGWTNPGLIDLSLLSGRDIITGGDYGPEGSLITTALLLLTISLIYLWKRKTTTPEASCLPLVSKTSFTRGARQ